MQTPNPKPDNLVQFPVPTEQLSPLSEQVINDQAIKLKNFIFYGMPVPTEIRVCKGLPDINCSHAHAVVWLGVVLTGFCYVPAANRWVCFQPEGAADPSAELVLQDKAKSVVQTAITTLRG